MAEEAEAIVELGVKLGLEGKELQDFLRDERAARREAQKVAEAEKVEAEKIRAAEIEKFKLQQEAEIEKVRLTAEANIDLVHVVV
jgi:uncharacterized protein YnzC (UPF0291/DUF896 family)